MCLIEFPFVNPYVTKKGGSRKPASMTRSPTDPGSHSVNPPQIHRHLTFPDLDYLFAIAHGSTCNLKTDRPSNASLDTTHSSGHTLHTDASEEKCSDIIHGLYT